MLLINLIFVILLGSLLGSFLTAFIWRTGQQKNSPFKLKERSFCPHCHHQLRAPDLIPIFSFIFQKGRCRYCNKKITWFYPLVEIGTILSLILLFQNYSIPNFKQYLFQIFTLIILFFPNYYDLLTGYILDKFLLASLLPLLISLFFAPSPYFNLIGMGVEGGLFLFIFAITQGKGMGWGDVKLSFILGLMLGWPLVIPHLLIAFWSGAFTGLLLVWKNKPQYSLKQSIPFGPFLFLSAFFVLAFSPYLINLTLKFIPLL